MTFTVFERFHSILLIGLDNCQRNTNQEECGDENEKPSQELDIYRDNVERPRPNVDCVVANDLLEFDQRKMKNARKTTLISHSS